MHPTPIYINNSRFRPITTCLHINKHNKPSREEIPWPVALPEGSMTECGEDILGLQLWAAHWAVVWLDLADGWGPTGINPQQNNTEQSFSHYTASANTFNTVWNAGYNSTKYVKMSKT